MKKLITAMMILFAMSGMADAQEIVYKAGTTVKGEDVTYRVRMRKDKTCILVQNVAVPDTTFKAIPQRTTWDMPDQYYDIETQVAMVIHETLTREELERLEKHKELKFVLLVLRVDRERHKLLQVTCFEFPSYYKIWSPDECFWLTLAPDRLYAIERAIVEKVEIPEQIQETFLTDDFEIILGNWQITDFEETKKRRKKYEKRWKADPKLDLKVDVSDEWGGVEEL